MSLMIVGQRDFYIALNNCEMRKPIHVFNDCEMKRFLTGHY